MTALPLFGIRVIDLSEAWAGPMATSLLGDMGAEVIKVESFPRASITRNVRPPAGRPGAAASPNADKPWEVAASHHMANRNKYGITLNLTRPQGLELFKRLIAVSDALIEGYSAGTAHKMGINYEELVKIRPDLIMVSMPGWGVEGPFRATLPWVAASTLPPATPRCAAIPTRPPRKPCPSSTAMPQALPLLCSPCW